MKGQFLLQELAVFQPEWGVKEIQTTFFKCTRWQVEDTLDPLTCLYHYYCESIYPGNYPPTIDIIVFLFALFSFLATIVIMALEISRGRGHTNPSHLKRLLLPSGPISLPLILLILAKGRRINTIFPLSHIGPAILQLVCISALAFDSEADKSVKYAFFEASTISGILHASLHLDSIILPFYTGLDALLSSTFSGECSSCICRKDELVVGGRYLSYRGLSVTTYSVVGTLCLRILCRLSVENKRRNLMMKKLLECFGWILLGMDSIYLISKSTPEKLLLQVSAYTGVLLLICLHLLRMACNWLTQWKSGYRN